jgi:hypothetical protein
MTTILNPSSFGKYNGFASKARGFCVHVFLVMSLRMDLSRNQLSNQLKIQVTWVDLLWFKTAIGFEYVAGLNFAASSQ